MLNINKRKIGFTIRLTRENKNITREQLAERMKVTKNYIYKIEAGKAGFTLDLMYKIAQALEVDIKEIYQWEAAQDDVTKAKDSEVIWREKNQLTEAGTLKTLVEKMIEIIEKQGIEVPSKSQQETDENYMLELVTLLPTDLQKKIQQKILDEAWKPRI